MFSPKFLLNILRLVLLIGGLSFPQISLRAQTYAGAPVKKSGLLKVLRSKQYQSREIVEVIKESGVDFSLSPADIAELVEAGARPEVIEAVRSHYRSPLKKTSPVSLKNDPAAKYQNLVEEALYRFNTQGDSEGAIQLLSTATQLMPKNPRAFQLLGYVYLYGLKNISEAERAMRQAVGYGGSAVLRVIHDHNLVFTSTCQGSLYINANSVRFESDNNNHTFETSDGNIKEIKVNSIFKRLVQLRQGSFKIVLRRESKEDETNFNFAPLSGSTDESKMVIRLIGKN